MNGLCHGLQQTALLLKLMLVAPVLLSPILLNQEWFESLPLTDCSVIDTNVIDTNVIVTSVIKSWTVWVIVSNSVIDIMLLTQMLLNQERFESLSQSDCSDTDVPIDAHRTRVCFSLICLDCLEYCCDQAFGWACNIISLVFIYLNNTAKNDR